MCSRYKNNQYKFNSQVFIHSPQDNNPQAQQLEGNITFLNVNQVITSLTCGQLDEQLKKDLLVVGTSTNITAYDIDRNVDLFFKEVRLENVLLFSNFNTYYFFLRLQMVHMLLQQVNGVNYPNNQLLLAEIVQYMVSIKKVKIFYGL